MATTAQNQRANLLSGLRTGGVRAASMVTPHTAGPTGAFSVPRFASSNLSHSHLAEESDETADLPPQNVYTHPARRAAAAGQVPMTAAVDGGRFVQQQQQPLSYNAVPFTPTYGVQSQAQAQAFQMQMMQMEIMRLQAIQAQQYQAEVIAQAQRQQQQQQANRRLYNNGSATAAPTTTTFDGQSRRPSHLSQLRSQLGLNTTEEEVPMTAGLSGKYGSHGSSTGSARSSDDESEPKPTTPSTYANVSRVISGGTSLGSPVPSTPVTPGPPSKADGATSWRRGGNNNSVLSGLNAVGRTSSPTVTITPPADRSSPAPEHCGTPVSVMATKVRPAPLQFDLPTQNVDATGVHIDMGDLADESDSSSTGSSKMDSPVTPTSSSSNPPLSPREEASKKLYDGLGLGRPVHMVGAAAAPQPAAVSRIASQPVRQPRGPPSGADELGSKNFATRIRRKAIGGLGALLDARERREVEPF